MPETTRTPLFKRYEILNKLGDGAYGIVFKAYDTRLGRVVALKILASALQNDEAYLKRFEREAQALSNLGFDHPHVVGVYDADIKEGYLTMEYVEGQDLRKVLGERHRLSTEEVVSLGIAMAEALAYVHNKGIIHRDVKPSNIILRTDGLAKLTDFGIAFAATLPRITHGVFLGTPEYASPEQARGIDLDGRSDLYSLGMVLYECLTGYLPTDEARQEDSHATRTYSRDKAPRLTYQDDVPTWLAAVINRCLERDPEARFPTGEALVEALSNGPVSAPAAVTPEDTTTTAPTASPAATPLAAPPVAAQPPEAPADTLAEPDRQPQDKPTRPRRWPWAAPVLLLMLLASGYGAWTSGLLDGLRPAPQEIPAQPIDIPRDAPAPLRDALLNPATTTTLNLANTQLRTIPSAIGALTNLERLNLSDNLLETLPTLTNLPNTLKVLNLSGNPLQAIPEAITQLPQLETLHLSRIPGIHTRLPDSLARLTTLTELYLSNDSLDTIPEPVTRLPRLETLYVMGNTIRTIPETLTRLTTLKALYLSNNLLDTIPAPILTLPSLTVLNLIDNQIRAIPVALVQLTNLTILNLSGNQIASLPDSLLLPNSLTTLNLSKNELTTLPVPLTRLEQLVELDLSSNQITTLPDTLSLSANLKTLDLRFNPIPDSLHTPIRDRFEPAGVEVIF